MKLQLLAIYSLIGLTSSQSTSDDHTRKKNFGMECIGCVAEDVKFSMGRRVGGEEFIFGIPGFTIEMPGFKVSLDRAQFERNLAKAEDDASETLDLVQDGDDKDKEVVFEYPGARISLDGGHWQVDLTKAGDDIHAIIDSVQDGDDENEEVESNATAAEL